MRVLGVIIAAIIVGTAVMLVIRRSYVDPRLRRRVSFPVRSNFFYENPVGLFLAVFATGGSMFPPFFRSAEKKAMNRVSLEILLDRHGTSFRFLTKPAPVKIYGLIRVVSRLGCGRAKVRNRQP